MSVLLRNIIRFILLILFQVVVLDRILIEQHVNPYLYMLFILLLPFNLPRPALQLLGFLLGITLDMFSDTFGLHAAACVFIAYLRPFILNILSPQGGFEVTQRTPSVTSMGTSQYAIYVSVLVLLHNIVYFCLSVFSFADPLYLLLKIVLSTVVSLFLVLIYELLFFSRK
ncbi:rod shape-determining protein MreD [Chitinophaga sp. SYP-B3965]|uniref:rod shape-determining protein MreD n=1 Tax=Chitinophaga sp. SYP-B3965 TaxID=2663120 RepID=UPI0012995912|nr:rod shape-determining protein MreD [Chitinophaga sp. SYP-B3965]MRG47739.1 rod shape-determining protein MreD [Chitinophaga sp. SYP-B3965]